MARGQSAFGAWVFLVVFTGIVLVMGLMFSFYQRSGSIVQATGTLLDQGTRLAILCLFCAGIVFVLVGAARTMIRD
jgi:hypothetical protein